MPKKSLVYVESPFAGDLSRNASYLRFVIRDSIKRGEAPFASHGFYTQFLDDKIPEQRALGIELGECFRLKCSLTAFYVDFGWSKGMLEGLRTCQQKGLPHEFRDIL